MKENLLLRNKIKKILKEIFEQDQNDVFDKEKAKNIFSAFINGEIDKNSIKVEDSTEMEFSDMLDANDWDKSGYANKKENPIIFFNYKGKEFSLFFEIEKKYKYEFERGNFDNPPHQTSDLLDVKLTYFDVEIADNEGNVVKLKTSDVGNENFKKFEKTLLQFID